MAGKGAHGPGPQGVQAGKGGRALDASWATPTARGRGPGAANHGDVPPPLAWWGAHCRALGAAERCGTAHTLNTLGHRVCRRRTQGERRASKSGAGAQKGVDPGTSQGRRAWS
jgi:hypothetical protein